jgi:ribose transport system substrate-binding protein
MNMLGKRIVYLFLATTLVLLAGCDRHQKSEQYFLIATNIDLPYWQTASDGLEKAAQQYGVTAEMDGPSTFDPQAEVQSFRSAVAKKPAGILVSVADANLMTPEIDSAVAAGIPVITIDSDAPDSKRLYFIGTNNLQAGRMGGERVARQLNGKGNVVFFSMPGQPNLDERLKGYEDAFSKYPGINIVEIFDMKGNSGTAMDKAQEYLARTGKNKVDGFICLEASAGKDVAEAFRRSNATGRVLVAMDVDQATLDLVKQGVIDSTISQKPYTMALYGLKALDDVHHYPVKAMNINYRLDPFSPFPTFVDTGVSLVDRTNVDNVLAHMKSK